MTLEIRLLGSPTFALSGQPLQLVRRKSIALLAWLAVTRRPQSREAVVGLLWPEFDRESALMNLRRDLSWLRKSLGDGILQADRLHIAIDPQASLWLDVQLFDSALAAVAKHSHPPSALCPDCVTNLSQAIELYAGDFMAGFSLADSNEFEEWLFFQREERRRAAGSALERLAGWYGSQSQHDPAMDAARRWLGLDPWHEAAHRALMRLYAQAGQQAAALRQYESCRQVLADEMGVEPEAETTALYEAIRTRQVKAAPPARTPALAIDSTPSTLAVTPPSLLPVPALASVGRKPEIAQIGRLLRGEANRLVTIVAPGGMGKTHLALAASAQLAGDFPDGVYFVPLAPLSDPAHIAGAIVQSMHLPSGGAQPELLLHNYLAEKRLLLVLDNCEHLLADGAGDGAGEGAGVEGVIASLLPRAPGVKILATCRERLQVQGEIPFVLGGLPLAEGDAVSEGGTVSDGGAGQLFVDCARRLRPSLVIDDSARGIVNRICRLVEGMPLALILAASWADMLSLAEIGEEVSRSLDFLETEMADVPARQRSIRAVFDGAWRRLSGDEQAVFCQLSLFQGGFTRQAAQSVAGASLRTLRVLVHKTLLTIAEGGRYQIHELLRQYGAEKLAGAGRDAEARTLHADYFLELLHRREADLRGGRTLEALNEIEADFENIRNAWGWALTQGNEAAINRSLEALHLFLESNGRFSDAFALFGQALQQLRPGDAEMPRLIWARIAARLSFMRILSRGNADSPGTLIALCLQTAQAEGDRFETAFCRYVNGSYLGFIIQEYDAAVHNLQQAVTTFREIGDDFFAVRSMVALNSCYNLLGLPEGRILMEQALELARGVGDLINLATVLNYLNRMAVTAGEYAIAEAYTREVLDLKLTRGGKSAFPNAMFGLHLLLRGQLDEAEQALEKSLEVAKLYNHQPVVARASALRSLCASLRGDPVAAQQFAGRTLLDPHNDRLCRIWGEWAMALALFGADEWTKTATHLRLCIEHIRLYKSVAMCTWLLPLTTALLAQANRPVEAVHHLALAHTHPLRPPYWLGIWPHLVPLQLQLEERLGVEGFHLAWEAGKSRGLDEAMGDIHLSPVNPANGWPGGA